MERRCAAEVEDLHRFFEGWFVGSLERSGAVFARLEEALAEGFTIVGPSGRLVAREELLPELRRAHGAWRPLGGSIRIENFRLRRSLGLLHVVTYVERQVQGGSRTARITTALLEERQAGPHGLGWLHVHETWLPPAP